MNKKILLLWDRMGDYHRARWRAIQDLVGEQNCVAADLGGGDGLYHWSNTGASQQYFQLSHHPVDAVPWKEALNSFKQVVRANQITHVCIPGYGRKVYIAMLLWCRLHGIKVMMFAESWYPGNRLFDGLKGMLVRATAEVCLVSGKRAASHFAQRLGYPSARILEGYSVVDNGHFASARQTPKANPPQLLCVARFAAEKNLSMLIDAFQASPISRKWQLRLVGGGPLKEALQKSITSPNIRLDDWLGYGQLPAMYAQASCFILPSSFEPWGLVVNEAMAAGLTVILSDAVGALPDLLQEGVNGWQFDHASSSSLIDLLNHLNTLSPTDLDRMGNASAQIVEGFSPQTWAQEVVRWVGE